MRALMLALATLSLFAAPSKPKVKVTTSLGAFTLQLEPEAAPKTVENFLKYVRKGFYAGTVFHRVVPDFAIQGGGYTENLQEKPKDAPVTNEAKLAKSKGMLNKRGTIALALPVGNPFGGTTQFFINVKDNPNLNFTAETMSGYGYCAFGKVVEGMDIVDKIRKVKTGAKGPHKNVPTPIVVIQKAEEVQ